MANRFVYIINSSNDIIASPQDTTGDDEALALVTEGLTENVHYIVSSVDIRVDESYTGIYSDEDIPLWKNVSGTPTLKSDSDKIEPMRAHKLSRLRRSYGRALNELDEHEGKAKTLLLKWLAGGSVGDPPQYWTDWETDRDSIDSNYSTKKTYINDEGRTFSQLDSYDTSL